MRAVKANINSAILSWARKAHNFSVEQVAKKVAVKPAKWNAWENAADRPSLRQLHTLANIFHLPEAIFYAEKPPYEESHLRKLTDFRGQRAKTLSPVILAQVSKAKSIRELVLELSKQLNMSFPKIPAITGTNVGVIAEKIRGFLNIDHDYIKSLPDANQALNYHRNLFEANGILVLQAENIKATEFSALAIAEEKIPIILLRSADEPNRKIFSLYHELTHVFLRHSAICSIWDSADDTEQLCDRVAGEVLLPTSQFEAAIGRSFSYSEEELKVLSKLFKVSRLAIALKLVHLNLLKWAEYKSFADKAIKNTAKRFGRGKEPHIPRILNKNGRLFARLVFEAYHRDEISLGDVCSYLKTKVEYVPKLENKLLEGSLG